MSTVSKEAAEKLLAGIKLPPRPSILAVLMTERNKANPDMRKISGMIARDVVLSAAMLKTVNSPYFGLRRKIDSIDQAVMTLGTDSVFNILSGLVLRTMNSGNNTQLTRFWDNAENTAFVAALIAKRVPGIPHNIAYTIGLFHDCGIPMMMTRFPDYKETLKIAESFQDRTITKTEDDRHSTNHATIGYLLSKNWNLSETVSLTILHHHNLDIFVSEESLPEEVCGLVAVIQIAEAISDMTQMRENLTWKKNSVMLLEYVGLSQQELEDITEEVMQIRNP